MLCPHPECTGVHDNNRYNELCRRSLAAKRIKDNRYQSQSDVWLHRGTMQRRRRALANNDLADLYERGGILAELHAKTTGLFLAREKKTRSAPVICTGARGIITMAQVLNYTHRPEIRTWFRL